MKINDFLDVHFSAHTEGRHVEAKFNFGISPLTCPLTQTSISIDSSDQKLLLKEHINLADHCIKEVYP